MMFNVLHRYRISSVIIRFPPFTSAQTLKLVSFSSIRRGLGFGVVKDGKTHLIDKFHKLCLVIWNHFRGGKTPFKVKKNDSSCKL